MKFLIIGDPHGSKNIKRIPKSGYDYILVTGDLGKSDTQREIFFKSAETKEDWKETNSKKIIEKAFKEPISSSKKILEYLAKIAPTYWVYGNIDRSDKKIRELNQEFNINLPYINEEFKKIKNLYLVNQKIIKLEDKLLAGYPYFLEDEWVKNFDSNNQTKIKRSKKETKKAKIFFEKLGYVDVLLTHQPPYGILDKVTWENAPAEWKGNHAGSKTILQYIKNQKPRYSIFGHIHEQKGKITKGKTTFINAGDNASYQILDL
ncbi:MAG: metallophosphoesterase [Candidatus Nanoarchaeia archaeon]|nr:metallophosphoesterase [Candidatus Nanoarchaeia archaeon]